MRSRGHYFSRDPQRVPHPPRRAPRGGAALRSRAFNVAISAFVVLNVVAVLRSNRPSWAGRAIEQAVGESIGPYALYRTRYAAWLVDRYAHLSGLNNRWQMFSHQSRFNWWYGVKALTAAGRAVELDLPGLGQRRFAQRWLFDFREAKYHLNLYGNEDLRQRYARHVCRQWPAIGGDPVLGIRFQLHHQDLLDPAQARARGTHLDPEISTSTMNEFSCLMDRASKE